MVSYEQIMDNVIMIIGDNGGDLPEKEVFVKLFPLPVNIDGRELSWKLGREYQFLEPYVPVGSAKRGQWLLTAKGWGRYNQLKGK